MKGQRAGSGGCHLHHRSFKRTPRAAPLMCLLALWHAFRGEGEQSGLLGRPPASMAPWDTSACPFCVAEKYNPIFVNEDKHVTWSTGPYNSAAWHKHASYLPLPPKVGSSPPAPPNWSRLKCCQRLGLCGKRVAIPQGLSSLLAGDKDGDLPAQHTQSIPPETHLPQPAP